MTVSTQSIRLSFNYFNQVLGDVSIQINVRIWLFFFRE